VAYIPKWPAGGSLELARQLDSRTSVRIGRPDQLGSGLPGSDRVVEGLIEPETGPTSHLRFREGWAAYWYSELRPAGNQAAMAAFNDAASGYDTSFPLLSLICRVPPERNTQPDSGNPKRFTTDRVEVLRLNGRAFDVSSAVAAGNLVILGHAEGPMPVPLELDGGKIAGKGVVFYQFVLPLERK
jgi:hypothetical protein